MPNEMHLVYYVETDTEEDTGDTMQGMTGYSGLIRTLVEIS